MAEVGAAELELPGVPPLPPPAPVSPRFVFTERSMLDLLNERYARSYASGIRYARAEHVKLTAGFDTRRICDYMALDLWPNGYGPDAGPRLHGFEVKVSRSDWLTELRDPDKAEAFARYCDFWWLVAAPGVVRTVDELPVGWGLLVPAGDVKPVLRAKRKASRRPNPDPMTRHLQATFARAVMKTTVRLDRRGDAALKDLVPRSGTERSPNRA